MSDSSEESDSRARDNAAERLGEIEQYEKTIRSISEESFVQCEADVDSITTCLRNTASKIGEKLDELNTLARQTRNDLAGVERKLRESNRQLLNTRSIKAMISIQDTIDELKKEQAALRDVKRGVEESTWMHLNKQQRTERTIAIFCKDLERFKFWLGLTDVEPEGDESDTDSQSESIAARIRKKTGNNSCSGSQPTEARRTAAAKKARMSTTKAKSGTGTRQTRKTQLPTRRKARKSVSIASGA